jgi:hypothetical protein
MKTSQRFAKDGASQDAIVDDLSRGQDVEN